MEQHGDRKTKWDERKCVQVKDAEDSRRRRLQRGIDEATSIFLSDFQ